MRSWSRIRRWFIECSAGRFSIVKDNTLDPVPLRLIQNSPLYMTRSAAGQFMNFHEYQSRELFAQYTVRTACRWVADSAEGAVSAAEGLGKRI